MRYLILTAALLTGCATDTSKPPIDPPTPKPPVDPFAVMVMYATCWRRGDCPDEEIQDD